MTTVQVIELRYEDYGSNNHKFYRAYTWANTGLTQWGRIGTKGQFKWVSLAEARRKVDEKLGGGYEVSTPTTSFTANRVPAGPGDPAGLTALVDAANVAIGNRVMTTPAVPRKSEDEVEEDFAKTLLAMKGKYTKPEAKPTPAEPEAPQTDPNSIEGRLGAALSAARDAS
jgi:predicted DNA-binding WGR domain protein